MTIRSSAHQRDIEDVLGELLTTETLTANNILVLDANKILVSKTGNDLVIRRHLQIAIYREAGTAKVDTNQPVAVQEIFNGSTLRTYADLREFTKVRIQCGVTTIGDFVKASGTVVCASVVAGDTVVVNGLTYTAVDGAKADDTEFSVDTSDTATATDLADSIDDDTRTGTIDDLTSTSSTATVTSVSTVAGTGGNAIAQTSSNGTRLAVDALFTSGNEAEMGIQYSPDDGSTWKGIDNDTTNGISDIFVKLGATGQKKSAFMIITASALIEGCLLRVVTAVGDGAVDPAYSNIVLEFQ